jgi:hypothetical protein
VFERVRDGAERAGVTFTADARQSISLGIAAECNQEERIYGRPEETRHEMRTEGKRDTSELAGSLFGQRQLKSGPVGLSVSLRGEAVLFILLSSYQG